MVHVGGKCVRNVKKLKMGFYLAEFEVSSLVENFVYCENRLLSGVVISNELIWRKQF